MTDHPGGSTKGSVNGKKNTGGKKKRSSLGLQTLQTLQSLRTPTTPSTPSPTYSQMPTPTPTTTTPSMTPWATPQPSPAPAPPLADPKVMALAKSIEALVADVRSMQGQVAALTRTRR